MQKVVPSIWFEGDAEAALGTYCALIPGSEIGAILRSTATGHELHGRPEGSVMTAAATLGGLRVTGLNGGPAFRLTPAISFFVSVRTEAEVDRIWEGLLEGGAALMPLDRYEWSPRYGWLQDRWGLSWQVALGDPAPDGPAVVPMLMFAGPRAGTAEPAMQHYTEVLPGTGIDSVQRHDGATIDREGTVMVARFRLAGVPFMAMDSAFPHPFDFNEALSLMVICEDQEEMDRLISALSAVPEAEQCGWVKDRFGVSWQIVPRALETMLAEGSRDQRERVMAALLGMTRLDLAALERAYAEGGA